MILERQPYALEEKRRILVSIADGLDYAHREGRDPSGHQALERARPRGRRRQDHGLRDRKEDRLGDRHDPSRGRGRNGRLHVARAGVRRRDRLHGASSSEPWPTSSSASSPPSATPSSSGSWSSFSTRTPIRSSTSRRRCRTASPPWSQRPCASCRRSASLRRQRSATPSGVGPVNLQLGSASKVCNSGRGRPTRAHVDTVLDPVARVGGRQSPPLPCKDLHKDCDRVALLRARSRARAGAWPMRQSLRPGRIPGGVITLLLSVSAIACAMPAWPASRVDPVVTLGAE